MLYYKCIYKKKSVNSYVFYCYFSKFRSTLYFVNLRNLLFWFAYIFSKYKNFANLTEKITWLFPIWDAFSSNRRNVPATLLQIIFRFKDEIIMNVLTSPSWNHSNFAKLSCVFLLLSSQQMEIIVKIGEIFFQITRLFWQLAASTFYLFFFFYIVHGTFFFICFFLFIRLLNLKSPWNI